jgi:cytosine deaminase
MTTNRELETLYDMVTLNAAQAINVSDHELKIGASANLVVLDAPNVLEALREHTIPRYVITNGFLVDRARMESVSQTGEWE